MASESQHVTPELEREAIDALSREFRAPLTRYFSSRIKEKGDVDDLVQEVFVRLAKRSKVSDLEKVGGYVFQTADSVLKDWLRRRRSRHADKHETFSTEQHGEADFTPERVLLGKRKLAKATAVLMELPERTRTIFVLRRLEGMPYKDISARLNMPVSTIENHMARAMKHLTDRLGEE